VVLSSVTAPYGWLNPHAVAIVVMLPAGAAPSSFRRASSSRGRLPLILARSAWRGDRLKRRPQL
jgi:hypothetical protein